MRSSIKRQPDGALSLKFPWKEEHPNLPSNFSVCAKRTRSLAQRLAEILRKYGQIITEQEAKGFIEKVYNFHTLYSPSGCQKGLGHHTCPHSIWLQLQAVIWPSWFKWLPPCGSTLPQPPVRHTSSLLLVYVYVWYFSWHWESISPYPDGWVRQRLHSLSLAV